MHLICSKILPSPKLYLFYEWIHWYSLRSQRTKISTFAWNFISTAIWKEKKRVEAKHSSSAQIREGMGQFINKNALSAESYRSQRGRIYTRTATQNQLICPTCALSAQCFPSCTYSVVLADIQQSSGPLVPTLRRYSWEQDTIDLRCRKQRIGVMSLCGKALYNPVLTMCVCAVGGVCMPEYS